MTTVAESLWQDYRSKGDPMARARLLERHLGLVHHVARQLGERFPSEIETDDLVSAGTLGLVRALESFDPSRGLEFSTYAIPRIRGSILDDLRDRDWVPRSVRAKARQVHGAVANLEGLLGRAPTPNEIAHVLELDMPTYWRWRREIDGTVPVSFDGPLAPDRHDAPSLEETLTDPAAPAVDHRACHNEEVSVMADAIQRLPKKERIVLGLYYYEEMTLRQIAEVLHLTESRISQIRSQALRRLRAMMSAVR